MPGRIRSRTAQIAGLTALVALLAASAALAAPGARQPVSNGPAQGPASRTERALLSLYALDSRLQSAHTQVTSLEAAAVKLRQQRSALRQELGAARSTLAVSQHQLGLRLRALYEAGNVDPVAVVLGATSLGQGLQKLDDLTRVTDQSRKVVAATLAARLRLLRAQRTFAHDALRLARSLAAAQAAERSLASAAAARASYVASLRRQAQLRQTEVRAVVTTASAAVQRSQLLQPVTPPVQQPPAGGRKMVVSATCYILRGRTATGMPVGPGVVAVDPTVIPLGTRLYIPGYGKGVAADVGGGIKGAIIDLWYSTYAQCARWGRRTVTITIY